MSESLVIEKSFYCRGTSSSRRKLEGELLHLYGRKEQDHGALIYSSGISAISAVFSLFRLTEKTIVIGSELYCDTPKVASFWNKNVVQVDVGDEKSILDLFSKENISLFFLESCSNPSGQILNMSLLSRLKQLQPNCCICFDNTWCTVFGFNPFQFPEVDIVVESMTKYISGGQCIGGMSIASKQWHDQLLLYSKMSGIFVGSDHCQIFSRGIETLEKRNKIVSERAQRFVQHLISNPHVNSVVHPSLISHPLYATFVQYFNLSPGVFRFHITPTIRNFEKVKEILALEKWFPYQTSFGSPNNKIDSFPKWAKKGIWLRFAIGSSEDQDEKETMKRLDEMIEYLCL